MSVFHFHFDFFLVFLVTNKEILLNQFITKKFSSFELVKTGEYGYGKVLQGII